MDNNSNKALYQLTRFINSEKSYSFALRPLDIAILFTIARYLDMGKGGCFAKQTQLAKECRTDRYEFGRHCKFLEKNNLLLRYMKGKLYQYELGYEITEIDQ